MRTMSKREKFIAVIMVSVLIIWGLQILTRSQGSRPNYPLSALSGSLDAAINPDFDIDRLIDRVEVKAAAVEKPIRDPFLRLDQKQVIENDEVGYNDLKLEGIFWEDEEPMALLNGEILRQGDTILGFEIVVIRKKEVVVSKDMERYILRVYQEDEMNINETSL